MATNTKPGTMPAQRRQELRDELWPDASKIVWNRKAEKGFCTIPRTLPLIMTLINHLSPKGKGDASRVYHELWCHAYDEGFVTLSDEGEHAYAAGYVTPGRGIRSWRERLEVLRDLGFIRVTDREHAKTDTFWYYIRDRDR